MQDDMVFNAYHTKDVQSKLYVVVMSWLNVVNTIEGWLTKIEGMFLFGLASICQKGVIVEIGSWVGKSTIYLAQGSKFGNKVHVYAVDPHNGEATKSPEIIASRGEEFSTLDDFRNHIELADVSDIVIPVVKTSEQAYKEWDDVFKVELVFIDGNHGWDFVSYDFKVWTEKLISGGILALHDTRQTTRLPLWPGPAATAQLMRDTGNYTDIGLVDTITYGVKK